MCSKMLISREKGRIKLVDTVKVSQGSFYTEGEVWLTKPVKKYIAEIIAMTKTVLDPFAGDGHILDSLKKHFNIETIGMDINVGRWIENDSLLSIPKLTNSFICTNPPYLAKHSAARKGVFELVKNYYADFDDLYQVALSRCFKAARFTIAIIPETFLNSTFPFQHLRLACIIEDNPFGDTDQPILVACFDSNSFAGHQDSDIYIGDVFCFKMRELHKYRYIPSKQPRIVFNDPHGRIALKAVDGVGPKDRIHFSRAEDFYYSRDKIKVSSRLLTYVEMPDVAEASLDRLIENANALFLEIRTKTRDLVLSPFKGNNKDGKRRRRLDYQLARYILENSYKKIDLAPREHVLPNLFADSPKSESID